MSKSLGYPCARNPESARYGRAAGHFARLEELAPLLRSGLRSVRRRVRLGKDGKLHGRIKIKGGDESTFVAERAAEPAEPIPSPPSYRDKWRPRR
jgi:hypothetical protein